MPKLLRYAIPILFACGLAAAPLAAFADDTPPPVPTATTTPAAAPPTADPPVDTAVVTVTKDGDVTATPGGAVDRALKDPSGVMTDIARSIRDGGGWRYAGAGVLVLLMALGIRFQLRIFGKTVRGRAIAVMAFSTAGAIVTTLVTPIPFTPKLLVGAVGLAWTAVGGRAWLKSVLWPDDGSKEWAAFLKPFLGAK